MWGLGRPCLKKINQTGDLSDRLHILPSAEVADAALLRLSFYMAVGHLNSGPHACSAGTFPPESSQPSADVLCQHSVRLTKHLLR